MRLLHRPTAAVSLAQSHRAQTEARLSHRLHHDNQLLQLENTKKTLYKKIQQAHYNAVAASAKLESSEQAVKSADAAFRLTKAKYENGKATITEFNESKNNALKAESDLAQAKYENMYYQAVIAFYRGDELKFESSLPCGQI